MAAAFQVSTNYRPVNKNWRRLRLFVFLSFQIVFFGGGWVFFLKKLFRDYEVSRAYFQLTSRKRKIFDFDSQRVSMEKSCMKEFAWRFCRATK